jgi:ribose transport system ATP-binding protein
MNWEVNPLIMGKEVLKMRGIDKVFPGVHALQNVDFTLCEGEIHALMGENGAGKSTLMKCLFGIYHMDEGEIFLDGEKVDIKDPDDAMQKGVAMVHQELQPVLARSIGENMYLGRFPVHKYGPLQVIDHKTMYEETSKWLKELGLDFDPKKLLGSLSIGQMQLVEIAKAVSHEAKVIIFDEPTAALTDAEIDQLFVIIRDLRARGYGIVYISHRMDEIKKITDRVSVMRDGQYIGTLITEECTKEDIIDMMVGRVIYEEPKTESHCPPDAPVVLKVEHLNAGRMVQDVSFELHKGEILGFAGLVGAGRTETMRALFGADPKQGGDIWINGKKVVINSPKDAVEAGISYLSEDRKRFGVVLKKSITENSTLATLKEYTKGVFIDKPREAAVTQKYVDALKTKTPGIDQLVMNLSGGNQQKVVIAKWLVNDSQIMIFDEPTRGIDVGAKQEIYELMNQLASSGKAIIMISSELPEILRMSDRVIVMCEGRKTGEFDISEATQEKIMNAATRDIDMQNAKAVQEGDAR